MPLLFGGERHESVGRLPGGGVVTVSALLTYSLITIPEMRRVPSVLVTSLVKSGKYAECSRVLEADIGL